MAYRPPTNGKPKLPPMLEARLMVAASTMKMTGSEALIDAAERWIKWSEQEVPRRAFKAAQRDYEAGKFSNAPYPPDFGLPRDYALPPAFR